MIERRRVLIEGIVQGVGFRPHVARVAARCGVSGFVGNDDLQVFIEAQGEGPVLDEFVRAVREEAPALARVTALREQQLPVTNPAASDFEIVASQRLAGARTLIPPDVATCPECEADIADPSNRRSGYAFTTCTNCGPRLSIIEDLPYDRPLTTMRDFPMCPQCASEYGDPRDRRYHAQPISCYACGPHLWIVRAEELAAYGIAAADPFAEAALPRELSDGSRGARNKTAQDAAIAAAVTALKAGQIVAVKGIGGFHLIADATNEAAVKRLRARKQRDGKPFAVMAKDLEQARCLVDLGAPGGCGEQLIAGIERPIVIAPRRPNSLVAGEVAPSVSTLGVMIAYSPLHQLLLASADRPLVATSGNLSSEPLCYTNEQALARLGSIADLFLLHNRDIAVPVEDSVVLLGADGQAVPMRRSRGYAPMPVQLAPLSPRARSGSESSDHAVVLGVGGELKNTLTLARDGKAFVSAHIGDMGSLAAQEAYDAAAQQLLSIHREQPSIIVHDAHPNYATTAWAQRYARRREAGGAAVTTLALQHHRAHALSLLAEHSSELAAAKQQRFAVIAALDGTGYGDDGAIWGSEVFAVDLDRVGSAPEAEAMERAWHLPYYPLIGADRAVKEPWRLAVAMCWEFGVELSGVPALRPWLDTPAGKALLAGLRAGGDGGVAAGVPVDSVGRYFDAVAAMLGLCAEANYEADAAVRLQEAAERHVRKLADKTNAVWNEPQDDFMGAIAREAATGRDQVQKLICSVLDAAVAPLEDEADRVDYAAYLFHMRLAALIAQAINDEAVRSSTQLVGITGGSAVNALLVAQIRAALSAKGYTVLEQRAVPPNDGGLSLGQAYYGTIHARARGA